MKTTLKCLLAVAVLFIFSSCKKASIVSVKQNASLTSENSLAASCTSKWVGTYVNGYTSDTVDVADKYFISNGIATLNQSPWSYYYSRIQLKIPACRGPIYGDSVKLQVRLRNNGTAPGAVFPYDVSPWLDGAYNRAHAQFLSYYVQYTALTVGTKGITNDSALLHRFDDWSIVTLIAKNNRLSVYINNVLIKDTKYTGNLIGKLKDIFLYFKGPGQIDWIKLYTISSASNKTNYKLKMSEDFNVDGQSSVVWY